MKTTLLVLALFCLLCACTKDSHRTTSTHFISATGSDGSSLFAPDTFALGAINGTMPPYGSILPYLVITTLVYPRSAGFSIASFADTPGTYVLDGVLNAAFYNYGSYITDSMHRSAHGTVTFTSVTPNLVGSFSFTCKDSVVVTGAFNVATP